MYDKIKPSKKRVKRNVAALTSLIGTEESSMTKRKFRSKPLIIAAVTAVLSMASLITVNAATKGAIVKFFMGGKEFEGEHYDYVDDKGYRRISFDAELPVYEDSYVIIYDVDAPQGENVCLLTEATDPDFMENLSLYTEELHKASEAARIAFDETGDYDAYLNSPSPDPEDFGITLKPSEIGIYNVKSDTATDRITYYSGTIGGEFMHTGKAAGKHNGLESKEHTDYDNGTHTYHHTLYYYVGKQQAPIKDSTEIEGEYYDNVDKNGCRRITFDAVLPYEEMTYAVIYDVDAPKDKNVRFLTPANDPEFFVNLRRYLDDRDKSIKESAAMWDKIEAWKGDFDHSDSLLREAVLQEAIEAGIVDPSEVPDDPRPEDYLFTCKDSELCVWEYIYRDEPGYDHATGGSFGGKFMDTGKSGENKFEEKRLGDGTKAIKHTFYYYAGEEE